MTETVERRGRDFFTDYDEPGIPWHNFVTALQVWAFLREENDRQTSVRDAADEFCVTDEVIREAVGYHQWMYVRGPNDDPTKQFICHEGE